MYSRTLHDKIYRSPNCRAMSLHSFRPKEKHCCKPKPASEIDISMLPVGLYFIRSNYPDPKAPYRFVKQ